MEKKFKVLRFIGSVYKIVGIIIAVLTILGSLGICVTSFLGGAFMARMEREFGFPGARSAIAGVIAAVSALISGAVLALTLYATGEGIFLLLSLEENTRATALYLHQYGEE
jgi:hypothetical protein